MSTSQDLILEYCLKNCLFDSWSTELLENACKNADMDQNYWKIDFPNGAIDVIDYFFEQTDKKMNDALFGSNLRTIEKIRAAIKARLEMNNAYKKQIETMFSVLALHPIRATKATYRTVDNIWRLAGDTATDWNFYSKRLLLAGVYTSTVLYWLNSNDESKTLEFLDNRLAEVGKFGKGVGKVKAAFKQILPQT